jgi:hypothetical protein
MCLVGCATKRDIPPQHDVPGMIRSSSNEAIDNAVRSTDKVSILLDKIRSEISEIYSIDEWKSLENVPEPLQNKTALAAIFARLKDGEKILVLSIDSDINIYLRVNTDDSVVAGVAI